MAYSKFFKRLVISYLILFFTIATPAADIQASTAVVCVEPAPLPARVILAIPYAMAALLYYAFGVVAWILSLALSLLGYVLYIPAFFLDVLLLRWITGDWVLLNAVSSLIRFFDFMDGYWRFGSEIHTKLWGNC